MKNDKKTFYNSLKNKHIFPAIMGLIITYCIIAIVAVIAFEITLSTLTDSKMESEYKAVSYMARLYGSIEDEEQAINILKNEGREFLILNTDGSIRYNFPENEDTTCSFIGGETEAVNIIEKIQVYKDLNEDAIEISHGSLEIVRSKMIGKINDNKIISRFFKGDENLDEKPLSMYFWISKEIDGDKGKLVAKAAYELKKKDVALIGIIAIIICVIAIILFVALVIRIIKRFVKQNRLLKVFFTDVVTKNHNWMWFSIKVEQHLQKRKNDRLNFAILNISVVKYNTFCLCHSLAEGEMVLQSINNTIAKSINKFEACAHHGTSSFAVLLNYSTDDLLIKKTKFILRKLEEVDKIHKFTYHIGIAQLPAQQNPNGTYIRRNNIDIEKEYNNACVASATLEGSDDSAIAFYDDKLKEEQKWIDTVIEKQKSAIENEEFVVYYQPKYNPSTDELRGAEALIRWQSPEFGFVSPGRFIPIFEKTGLITNIDHYMISKVAKDQKRWLDAGFKCVPVSVNVSRAHFIEEDLAEQIRDAVDNEGTPRNLIEIELTESAFFDDKKAMIATIEKLKSYGFAVSMDDFGAGYSSLNSLKDMPLDVLKLDADFFRGETEGGRGEIVVSEAIKLAKALHMHTVAEGVEIKDQVDFLAKQGCDMIQGYYYAKPMAGTDFELRMSRLDSNDSGNEYIDSAGLITMSEDLQDETNDTVSGDGDIRENAENITGFDDMPAEDIQVSQEELSIDETSVEPDINGKSDIAKNEMNAGTDMNEQSDITESKMNAGVDLSEQSDIPENGLNVKLEGTEQPDNTEVENNEEPGVEKTVTE